MKMAIRFAGTAVLLLVYCCVSLVLGTKESKYAPIVKLTNGGEVRGIVQEADDDVLAHLYQGIRYGEYVPSDYFH